jgi:predicted small lipoprotein YifL
MTARAALLLVAAAAVSACGVRGNLELPPEQKAAETSAQADSGQGKPENTAPKPHKGFILDGLLR